MRQELIPKVKQFFIFPAAAPGDNLTRGTLACACPLPIQQPEKIAPLPWPGKPNPAAAVAPRAVGIGISTGGPAALAQIMPKFPSDFPLPIFIVQHMPALFTRLLAERLDSICPLVVREGVDGAIVEPGQVWIAPGDYHMRAVTDGADVRIRLDQGPAENSCRPAVDTLFESLAQVYGPAVVGAVLTGMGYDGKRGGAALKAKGAYMIAQDEESSVVWGMPRALADSGLADTVLPLDRIPDAIVRRAMPGSNRPQGAIRTGGN